MQNPFVNPAFSMTSLTAAINIIPNRYGRIGQLGLFNPKPVIHRNVIVEEMHYSFAVIFLTAEISGLLLDVSDCVSTALSGSMAESISAD